MYYNSIQNISVSALGMGNMRLPGKKDGAPDEIDYEKAQEIIDYAMANGINYYDTAWVYNNGKSEEFLGHALKKYNRNDYYLATKFFIQANPDYKLVFETQLKRLNTDHIDFYLIHCLLDGNIDSYLESGAIEYFLEQKKAGRIGQLGFSSHSSPQTLERFAKHHQWDFAQIQLNYYDWKYGNTEKEYKILEENNIPCVVMEPVRGGRLASLTPDAEKMLKEAHPDWSIASWALRFAKSLSNCRVILSGMSNMEQIKDNINTFSKEDVLSEADKTLLSDACSLFRKQLVIPCTGCRYCTSECPVQINIPEYLKVYNAYKTDGPFALGNAEKVESQGKPSDCINCRGCMNHCPQGIEIPKYISALANLTRK